MKKLFVMLCLMAWGSTGYALSESEPFNNDSSGAVSFSFPQSLTGNLNNDGGPQPIDYWKFTASAGQEVQFVATVTGGGFGADIALDLEDSIGSLIDDADNNGNGGTETITLTIATSGTYYLVIYTDVPNGISSYTITASVTNAAPDTTPPTFPGGTSGINTVERISGNTTANVTWFQATDDVTSNANIAYDIYYDPSQAAVFSGAAKKTVTGSLSTVLTGLDSLTTYYVGVRARDAANNGDANTRTLFLDLAPTAAHAGWALYE